MCAIDGRSTPNIGGRTLVKHILHRKDFLSRSSGSCQFMRIPSTHRKCLLAVALVHMLRSAIWTRREQARVSGEAGLPPSPKMTVEKCSRILLHA